jgi:hypothetical protein
MIRTTAGRSTIGARFASAVVATVITTVSVVVPAAASSAASDSPPDRSERYLLALGDSISFGFQGPKVTDPPNPAAFDTGYVDVLAARDRSVDVVNYSCPGETTTTFIGGGCPWRQSGFALHDEYRGSQLVAAVGYLLAHRKNAGTVTVAIWGNDILALRIACGGDLGCVSQRAPAEIAAFARRLGTILWALRAAAPSADIVVLAAFHAFPPPTPEIDALYRALNTAVADTAATVRADVADARPVFNPPDDATRATALCVYTLVCATNGADAHPSDAG